MAVNSLTDIINTLNKLKTHDTLEECFDESEFEFEVNPQYIADDEDLRENVDETILSASYYLLDDFGRISKQKSAPLFKEGYTLEEVKQSIDSFFLIKCDKFVLRFGVY